MIRIKNMLSLLWVMVFLLAGCSNAQSVSNPGDITTALDLAAGEQEVTFVELGSVNCVPCKMMQPVMDKIEKDYAGKVKVVFYDVWTDEGKPYARKYGIQAIPTQVFLDKQGKEFYRHMGFLPEENIVEVLQKQGVNKP